MMLKEATLTRGIVSEASRMLNSIQKLAGLAGEQGGLDMRAKQMFSLYASSQVS